MLALRLAGAVTAAALVAGDAAVRAPPFAAWVEAPEVYVRERPGRAAPPVGVLERGDRLQVVACSPDCADAQAWALLAPRGAVPMKALRLEPIEPRLTGSRFLHARPNPGAPRYAAADVDSKILDRAPGDETVAVLDDPKLLQAGWLQCVDGGFLLAADAALFRPSGFTGVHHPPPLLAFFLRGSRTVARLDWRPVLGLEHGAVRVAEGLVPRADVRLARKRPRPAGVPAGARWVDVDTEEQVLTAYEGDALVFATLVSTGKPGFRTRPGLYPVWLKARHVTMEGVREPYRVEQVPDVLFFRGSDALHGAFWHERFGRAGSHGCVNLSPLDARWLFAWAPPELPEGWHASLPRPGEATLWVNVHAGDTGLSPPGLRPRPPVGQTLARCSPSRCP